MSAKSGRAGKHAPFAKAIPTTPAEAESLLQAGRLTEAIDCARLCFRQNPGEATRLLLERALYAKVEQLHREGKRNAARDAAKSLLDLGPTDPKTLAGMSLLLAPLGFSQRLAEVQEKLASPEVQALLIPRTADLAVLHPDQAGLPVDLLEGAYLVRAALVDLDAGQEEQAQERLRDVPRNSPFADWRLFVRGLVALRRGNAEQVSANWDRLDAERAAARIARHFRPPEGLNDAPQDLAPVERLVFGEPVLAKLAQVGDALHAGDLPSVVKLIGPVRSVLRRIDPRLSQRLTELLLDGVTNEATERSYEDARRWVDKFAKEVDPLPFDPHWKRLWALMFEQVEGEFVDAVRSWEEYAAEVDSLSCWTPEQRRRAKALVFVRIAKEAEREANPLDYGRLEEPPTRKRAATLHEVAARFLEKSQREDPSFRPGFELLFKLQIAWDRPHEAFETAKAYSAAFTDAVEPLLFSAKHLVDDGQANAALPLAERARELKPLDVAVMGIWGFVMGAVARKHAFKGRFEEARATLTRRNEIQGLDPTWWLPLAQRAALEFKAGETVLAEAILEQSLANAPATLAAWLQIGIEGERWRLPAAIKTAHAAHYRKALSGKVTSAAAGAVANVMSTMAAFDVRYAGRTRHERDAIDYLNRASRVKWELDDLVAACNFLMQFPKPKDHAVFKKLAAAGARKFKDRADALWFDAHARLSGEEPPYDGWAICNQLERAKSLAESGQTSAVEHLGDRIKADLALATSLTRGPFGLGGLGGGFLDMFRNMMSGKLGLSDLNELEEDDLDDDEDDFDDAGQRSFFDRFESSGEKFGAPKSKPAKKTAKGKKG